MNGGRGPAQATLRTRRAVLEAIATAYGGGIADIAREAGVTYYVAVEAIRMLLARGDIERQCRYRVVRRG